MSKATYQCNSKTLQLEKQTNSFRKKLLQIATTILAGFMFSVVILFFAYNYLDSPKERILQRELDHYKTQYKLMNEKLDEVQVVLSNMQVRDDEIYRTIFETDPIPAEIRTAGVGGADRYSHLANMFDNETVLNTAKKIDVITSQLYIQSKSYDELTKLAANRESLLNAIPAIQPLSLSSLQHLSSHFGYRTDPFYKITKFHKGVDFTAPTGTPIYATADGKITAAGSDKSGYGTYVEIDHGHGYTTLYAHLSKMKVKRGQKIKRGEVIGLVGNTGKSTGPHLHYEVHKNGAPQNPIDYFYNDITPREYAALIEVSKKPSKSLD